MRPNEKNKGMPKYTSDFVLNIDNKTKRQKEATVPEF
uniref:Uncharacterized protein n=1 Tax=Rhizophora mucronata TaxID=61149 RepID=A0A2P2NBS4_RHIMU